MNIKIPANVEMGSGFHFRKSGNLILKKEKAPCFCRNDQAETKSIKNNKPASFSF